MQKEITTFDFIFFMLDKIYAVIMLVMMVGMGFYTTNHKGLILLILLGILGVIIKTVVGLFNYSMIVDVLQSYLDIGMTLCMGRIFGLVYNLYITDFYNFNAMSFVMPLSIAVAFLFTRIKMENKRIYREVI